MGTKKDVYVGAHFGEWTVLEVEVKNPESKAKRVRKGALCQCSCGTLRYIEYRSLYDGRTTNCGCIGRQIIVQKRMLLNTLYPGQKFGKLTVIEDLGMVGNDHKSKCQCDCGNIVIVANDHLRDLHTKSCGCLTSSYGALKIEQLLKENNIPYIKEYTFNDLRSPSGGALRFDFAIFKDKSLLELIEFDGEQHDRPIGGWFEGQFNDIQMRDNLKNVYCEKHNIKLVRIKYRELLNISLSLLQLDNYYMEKE